MQTVDLDFEDGRKVSVSFSPPKVRDYDNLFRVWQQEAQLLALCGHPVDGAAFTQGHLWPLELTPASYEAAAAAMYAECSAFFAWCGRTSAVRAMARQAEVGGSWAGGNTLPRSPSHPGSAR